MLSPDDITQVTGPLEQTPAALDRQSPFSEQRQERQTTDDLSPRLRDAVVEVVESRPIHRQMLRLRQENRRLHLELEGLRQENKRLHPELETLRSERQQIVARLSTLQREFDEHVATIHSGHLQETEHYEGHLRELMEEHNRLQTAYLELEQRYQELQHMSEATVEEEARGMVAEAIHALERSSERVPPLLADAARILELRTRQEQEEHLVDAFSLRRELESMVEQLEQERQELAAERQHFLAMQQTANEHAKQRLSVLQTRLRTQWTTKFTLVTTSVLFLLVILQFLLLNLFRVLTSPLISLSLVAPIVVCTIIAVLLAYPRSTMARLRASLPRKKVVKKEASEKKTEKK